MSREEMIHERQNKICVILARNDFYHDSVLTAWFKNDFQQVLL